MKKSLFLIAASAFALASCSNDEVVDMQKQSAIGFDSYVGKTTRATDASMESLTEIYVYGYIADATPLKIFNDQHVTKSGTEWTYSPVQYWAAGKSYFFTAIASPLGEGNTQYAYNWAADADLPTTTEGFCGTGTISFNNDADKAKGNEDLVYAYATTVTADPLTASPGKVQFAFKHALSRVKFTFTNAMGSDSYSIKVYDLQINNSAAQASLTLGAENPVWTGHTSAATLVLRNNLFNPSSQTALNTANVVSGTKFIIPESEKALSITFKVDLMINGTLIDTYNHSEVMLPATTFQNGHSYNFIAELNPQNIDPDQQMFPIEFNVQSVAGWEEDPNIPVTLPEKE